MSQNNKIWKFIGIVVIVYMIIWFWPVLFHRPFFNDPNSNVQIEVMPYSNPYGNGRYVQTAPGDHPEYEDPTVDSSYDPNNSDPIVPPHSSDEPTALDEPVACTMEAKVCPDGSYVGRTGPNCEFAPCPGN